MIAVERINDAGFRCIIESRISSSTSKISNRPSRPAKPLPWHCVLSPPARSRTIFGGSLQKNPSEFSEQRVISVDPAKCHRKIHWRVDSGWFFLSPIHRSSNHSRTGHRVKTRCGAPSNATEQGWSLPLIVGNIVNYFRGFGRVVWFLLSFEPNRLNNQTTRTGQLSQVNQTVVGAARAWCCRTARSSRDRTLCLLAVQSVGELA